MAKAARRRIANRGQVNVDIGTGTSGVPATVRVSPSAPSGGTYIASDRFAASGLTMLSSGLAELRRQAEKAADRAYQEEKLAESRAYQEAKEAQRNEEAKLAALESAAGLSEGLKFGLAALNKVNSGEYGASEEMLADFQSSLNGLGSEHTAYISAYTQVAGNVLGPLSRDLANQLQGRTTDNLLGTVAQAQNAIYESLDTISPEQFIDLHQKLLSNSLSTGLPQVVLEDAMVTAFANAYNEAAAVDADRASTLHGLGKEWSKTLTSKAAQDKLSSTFQAGLANTVNAAHRAELKMEKEETKRKTQNFNGLISAMIRQTDGDAILQQLKVWESDEGTFEDLKTSIGEENVKPLFELARKRIKEIELENTPDWENIKRTSDDATAEWINQMIHNGKIPTFQEIDSDSRLTTNAAADLKLKVLSYQNGIRQDIEPAALKAFEELQYLIPQDASWEGGYVVTAEGVAFDSQLADRLQARLRTIAYEAYTSVNPTTDEGQVDRKILVATALRKGVDDILKNGHLYNINITEQTRRRTGEVRPRVTGEDAVIDFVQFPTQREDIEKGLFSQPTGLARTAIHGSGNSYYTNFNVAFYDSLPSKGKEMANFMLQKRAVDEYVERYKHYTERWSLWSGFGVTPGFDVDDNDYTSEELRNRYTLDITR